MATAVIEKFYSSACPHIDDRTHVQHWINSEQTCHMLFVSRHFVFPNGRSSQGPPRSNDASSPCSTQDAPVLFPSDDSSFGLKQLPLRVLFFIPGNPGVSSAYVPWFKQMIEKDSDLLVVFSGHLGHLKESPEEPEFFTCEENIQHQASLMQNLLRKLAIASIKFRTRRPPVFFGGHSAGAFFVVRALERLLDIPAPPFRESESATPRNLQLVYDLDGSVLYHRGALRLIIYCGTLVQFGPTGLVKARIAATETGLRLMKRIWRTNFIKKRVDASPLARSMFNEFSENFMNHMSTLCRDELHSLPQEITEEIDRLVGLRLGVETFESPSVVDRSGFCPCRAGKNDRSSDEGNEALQGRSLKCLVDGGKDYLMSLASGECESSTVGGDWEEEYGVERESGVDGRSGVYFLWAANDSYVSKRVMKLTYRVFGRSNVFISPLWWHAFCLHSDSIEDASLITVEGIMRKGRIPSQFQEITSEIMKKKLFNFKFDSATFLASIIVSFWNLMQAPKRLSRSRDPFFKKSLFRVSQKNKKKNEKK